MDRRAVQTCGRDGKEEPGSYMADRVPERAVEGNREAAHVAVSA